MIERILVLGGNGRTGRDVVDLALERGWGVNALVRRAESIEQQSDLLTVIEGSPMDFETVAKAMLGVDAVVSTLNNGRTSDNPWAKPTSPVNLMRISVRNAIDNMYVRDIRRISVLSAAGVGDSYADSPWVFRQLIRRSNMRQAFDDHNAVDELLRRSDVDWTQARAMGLAGRDPKGRLVLSYGNVPKPGMFISRRTVATFLLDSLTDESLIGQAPVISER